MRRLVPFGLLFVSCGAFASSKVFCFPGVPWCDGADLGLGWIPVVVGLQLGFLYLAQGGPAVFLARFAGHDEDWAEQRWGVLQVGLPIALVMAFPALAVLAVVGKWLRPVGLLEIFVVQGAYWLMLVRLPWRDDAGQNTPESVATEAAPALTPDTRFIGIGAPAPRAAGSAIDAGVAAVLARAAGDGIPLQRAMQRLPAGAAATLAHPERIYGDTAFHAPVEASPTAGRADKAIERLIKTYMWDDVGSAPAFRRARKLPVEQLVGEDDAARFGTRRLEALRAAARHTIVLFRDGVDATTLHSIVAIHDVEGFDEYSADVMQRLTYSALLDRQRLFVDQTDIEIFGEDFVECMYRLALAEVRVAVVWRSDAGGRSAAAAPRLQ